MTTQPWLSHYDKGVPASLDLEDAAAG